MSDNFLANWTPSDDEEQKRRAWEALAARSAPDINRTLEQPVRIPEVNIQSDPSAVADDRIPPERNTDLTPSTDAQASPDMPPDAGPQRPVREPPVVAPGTDAADSPQMPPDAPKLAQLGAALSKRDLGGDAPSPPPADSTPVRRSSSSEDTGPSFGGTALAALADVLLNHGRGVGSILALSGEANSPKEKAKLDLLRAQAEHLRNPNVDPTTMAYKQAMLDLQREREKRMIDQGSTRADLTRTNIENTQNRFDTKWNAATDPNSALNRTKVEVAGQTAGAGAAGRINTEHALNDVVAGDKAQIGGAEVAARLGATHDLAPVTTADEAAKAAAVTAAQTPPKLAYEESLTPILNGRANNGVGVGLDAEKFIADNQGLDFKDPEQIRRIFKSRGIPPKFIAQVQAANRAAEINQAMHDTERAYKAIPSEVQAGHMSIADAVNKAAELSTQYGTHRREYAGVMGAIGGNANEHQQASDEAAVPSINSPLAEAGIRGLWGGMEANTKANLGVYGVHPHLPRYMAPAPGLPPAQAGLLPGEAASGGQPGLNHDGNAPPVALAVPGNRPAPIPSAAADNSRPREVTKPSGKVVMELLSDEQAAQLASMPGWKVR